MKIVFLCQFSNTEIRSCIKLNKMTLRNWICQLLKHPTWNYNDCDIWIDDFIEEFKKHINEHEFHIVAHHKGMKRKFESFEIDGIFYHFYKSGASLLRDYINAKFRLLEKTDYRVYGKRAAKIINRINPDVICLCGAENPQYGSAVFFIKDKPIFLIPQTFLNDGKRVAMKCASQYRADFEKKVFSKVNAISAEKPELISFVKSLNPNVNICYVGFPTHKPVPDLNIVKKYDFVFFAKKIASFKGIEDVINALAIVKAKHPAVNLAIIGGCGPDYRIKLEKLIGDRNLQDNIYFLGLFSSIKEMHRNVQMARISVLPGITASLNSTVREAMSLGIPPIVYRNEITDKINSSNNNLCVAQMQDVEDLSKQMELLLDNPQILEMYKIRGNEYVSLYFNNQIIVDSLLVGLKKMISC